MNSPTDVSAGTCLFATDTGALALDTRKVLCKLLTGPFMDSGHELWPALLRDEALVRARLSELFLDLIIDRDRKIAFTRQSDTGELVTPVLQRTHPLSYLESVLLLHLRQRLVEADNQDERAVIDNDEIQELLEVYAAASSMGASRVDRRIVSAVNKMRKDSVLRPLPGIEGRYEISPALRLMFGADDVQALSDVYRRLALDGAERDDTLMEDADADEEE